MVREILVHHVLEEIKAKEGLGAWNVYAALYGTKEQVEVNWQIITGAIKASGEGRIITEEEAGETQPFNYRAKLMRGDMTLQEFGLYRWRGGGGSMWFAPVAAAKGSETIEQTRLAKEILAEYGLDYVAEYVVGMRDMHHIIDVLYDRSAPAEMASAHECFAKLLSEFDKRGYAVYRVNTAFMDQTADLYGPVKRKVDQTLKRALDPNGILAPGKSGIRICGLLRLALVRRSCLCAMQLPNSVKAAQLQAISPGVHTTSWRVVSSPRSFHFRCIW